VAAPHLHLAGLGRHRIDHEGRSARRVEPQSVRVNRRHDERERGQLALRDEATVAVDDHPLAIGDAVVRDPGGLDRAGGQREAARALDRIEIQRRDARRDVVGARGVDGRARPG
jgi:hypothetical protein